MRRWLWFALAWVAILGGGFLAHLVQTSNGRVEVTEVAFKAEQGETISGLLYRPKTATAAKPAPGILVSHGYINTREMQSPFAIELSRRGYVVLAMDMAGHGYSGGIVGTDGAGGPAALRYLRGLAYVDKANVGMEGHSMGGMPVMAAAADQPDGYRSIVLEGSTPGMLRSKAPPTPKNTAVVFGQYEEFAGLMWQVPSGDKVGESKRLKALFGTDAPVVSGQLYGDVAAGTGRKLYSIPTTHPLEHFSSSGVAGALEWFGATLAAPANPLPASDQGWIWKEVGTLIGFLGMMGLIVATFDLLLSVPVFAGLNHPAEPVAEGRNGRWWLALAITAALPALTYFPLMKWGSTWFKPYFLFPQSIHNQLVVWAVGTGLISLVIGLVLRPGKARFTNRWAGSIGIAVATMAVAYLSIVVVDALFKTDFRFWVVGIKPLSSARLVAGHAYLFPWIAFFLIAIRGYALNIAVRGESFLAQLGWAKVAFAAGFFVLVAWEYATMAATHHLGTPKEPLNAIVAIQFVPLLAFIGIIGAWTYRRTNSYVPGALICAMLITWYVASGTANHVAPGFKPEPPPAARAR